MAKAAPVLDPSNTQIGFQRGGEGPSALACSPYRLQLLNPISAACSNLTVTSVAALKTDTGISMIPDPDCTGGVVQFPTKFTLVAPAPTTAAARPVVLRAISFGARTGDITLPFIAKFACKGGDTVLVNVTEDAMLFPADTAGNFTYNFPVAFILPSGNSVACWLELLPDGPAQFNELGNVTVQLFTQVPMARPPPPPSPSPPRPPRPPRPPPSPCESPALPPRCPARGAAVHCPYAAVACGGVKGRGRGHALEAA